MALTRELEEWAARNGFKVEGQGGDGLVSKDVEDRTIMFQKLTDGDHHAEVCQAGALRTVRMIEGSLSFCAREIRLAIRAINTRHQIARCKSRKEAMLILTGARGLPALELRALRLDLGLRDQVSELLRESIIDEILPKTKSLTADEARRRLYHARNYDDVAEVVTKMHGSELEKLRRHYRVKEGLEPVVQHRIIDHVISKEA